jgi:hypothetical protein
MNLEETFFSQQQLDGLRASFDPIAEEKFEWVVAELDEMIDDCQYALLRRHDCGSLETHTLRIAAIQGAARKLYSLVKDERLLFPLLTEGNAEVPLSAAQHAESTTSNGSKFVSSGFLRNSMRSQKMQSECRVTTRA